MSNARRPGRLATIGALLSAGALVVVTAAPAGAETISAAEARAFGGSITLGGEEAIPPTPLAESTLPGDVDETAIDIPADPLAVSGTLNATATVHVEADIPSALEVVTQEVEGPYNATAVGSIEEADVLLDAVAEDVSLVSADLIRAEAVAVCVGGTPQYAANSEIISLAIGGEDVPLNAPITELIDGLQTVLEESGLNALVDVQRNVITESPDGIAVDALVVTVLAAAGETPLGVVTLGHAEVNGVVCGAVTECNDGVDNGDPEDTLADIDDPECHTDGDAGNPDSYDPTIASETGTPVAGAAQAPPAAAAQLPATGGNAASTAGLAAVMAAGALGLVALRRRVA